MLLLQLQQSNELGKCISCAFIETPLLKSTRLSKLESAQITSRPKSCVMPKVWLGLGEGEGGGGGGGISGMRKPSHQGNSLPFGALVDFGISWIAVTTTIHFINLATNAPI